MLDSWVCGNRGSFVANLMQKNGSFRICRRPLTTFRTRLDAFGETFEVDKARRFTGLNGFRKLLEDDGVKAIAVHSPRIFSSGACGDGGLDAGKHVFIAKPIAVDVPGVRSIEASTAKAKEKGALCLRRRAVPRGPVFSRSDTEKCTRRERWESFSMAVVLMRWETLASQAQG